MNEFPSNFSNKEPPSSTREIPTTPPPMGDSTNRQAAQFQPTNMAIMAGVIGLNNSWHNAWNWEQAPAASATYGGTPSPALFSNYSINGLPVAWPGQYSYFRKILNDATVRFVRMIAFAPVMATKWIVKAKKGAPDGAADLIQDMMDHVRPDFVENALRGVDYGWAGFEQIFELVERGPHKGRFWLKRLKPLLHDFTSIYITEHGDFNGFNNNGTIVDPNKALLYTHDGESGNLYGRGRCWNLLEIVPWWRDANDGAARYDRKIAGVFMVCHYPPGKSMDRNGVYRENWEIAQTMLDSVAAGKPIAVCNEFAGEMENNFLQNISMADRTRWKIELLEDKGSRQPGFSDRLAYLDRQKARAYMTPERTAFEAQKSGSKADSESHSDVLLMNAVIISSQLARLVSGADTDWNSPINNVLRMNFGDNAVGLIEVVPEET